MRLVSLPSQKKTFFFFLKRITYLKLPCKNAGQARLGYQASVLAVPLPSWPSPGTALVPYGLPCIRELFRFLISLTNPHDRHNSEVMIHMGLHLLTVALESAPIAQCQSLLGLIKDEMCRHLFQVRLDF